MTDKYIMVDIYSLGGSDMKATIFVKMIEHNLPEIEKLIKYFKLGKAFNRKIENMSNDEVDILMKYMRNDGSCDAKHMVKYCDEINVPTKSDDMNVDDWFGELFTRTKYPKWSVLGKCDRKRRLIFNYVRIFIYKNLIYLI